MIVTIGYLASVFLALSLLVTNDLSFRWLNTFGCLFFIVYGIMIMAFPIIITNSLLFGINIFYLVRIYRYRVEEDFDLIEVKLSEPIVQKFLLFYKKDIHAFFPSFQHEKIKNEISFIVLRDMVIANLFVAELKENGIAEVKINYTVPAYRDYKVGRFIFDKEKNYLHSRHVRLVTYKKVENKGHQKFLTRMNFIRDTENGYGYVRTLT